MEAHVGRNAGRERGATRASASRAEARTSARTSWQRARQPSTADRSPSGAIRVTASTAEARTSASGCSRRRRTPRTARALPAPTKAEMARREARRTARSGCSRRARIPATMRSSAVEKRPSSHSQPSTSPFPPPLASPSSRCPPSPSTSLAAASSIVSPAPYLPAEARAAARMAGWVGRCGRSWSITSSRRGTPTPAQVPSSSVLSASLTFALRPNLSSAHAPPAAAALAGRGLTTSAQVCGGAPTPARQLSTGDALRMSPPRRTRAARPRAP